MKPYLKAVAQVKKAWRRLTLKNVRYSNDYEKLNAVYAIPDPWIMKSQSEQFRFSETNRLILERFGRQGSILEIGCGEGHQSLFLQQVCKRLTGLDVSARAVMRARSRCPQGEFLVGDIFLPEVAARAPFDLVIASEVLYYISDVHGVLGRMRELGRNNLVTYFVGEMANLDPQVLSLPGAVSEMLEFENVRWRAVWWRGDQV